MTLPPTPGYPASPQPEHGSYSFGDAVKRAFKNYSNFNGRARRSEYWWFYLFTALCMIPLNILLSVQGPPVTAVGDPIEGGGTFAWNPSFLQVLLLALAVVAVFFLPSLAVSVRRLHDTNTSGAYLLLGLIPFVGAVLLLVKMATEGTAGPNAYGMRD